jgi:hypothetical protein
MARLLDDNTENERLISWLRVMFPEARAEVVLRPAGDTRERPVDSKDGEAAGRNTPYGLLLQLLQGRRSRSPRVHTSN